MKKILLILTLGLVACSGESQTAQNQSVQATEEKIENVTEKETEVVTETETEAETEKELPIYPDEIPYEITVREPDSIGNIYADLTYTNNSPYPITSYRITAILKDSNEKVYYSSYDTVLPGETSPNFDSFGPQTGLVDDIEVTGLEIRAINDDIEYRIDYDLKLERAEWEERPYN